jgi:hypothetical protein
MNLLRTISNFIGSLWLRSPEGKKYYVAFFQIRIEILRLVNKFQSDHSNTELNLHDQGKLEAYREVLEVIAENTPFV